MKVVAKAIAAGVTATMTWAGTALADGKITGPEWVGTGGIVLAICAVYQVKNMARLARR